MVGYHIMGRRRSFSLFVNATQLRRFLYRELWAVDLERMAPHLWIMSTQSSSNVSPLHQQKVKGREIVVTEDPRLHLVWIYDRVFIKPLPRYVLVASAVPSETVLRYSLIQRRLLPHCDHVYSMLQRQFTRSLQEQGIPPVP